MKGFLRIEHKMKKDGEKGQMKGDTDRINHFMWNRIKGIQEHVVNNIRYRGKDKQKDTVPEYSKAFGMVNICGENKHKKSQAGGKHNDVSHRAVISVIGYSCTADSLNLQFSLYSEEAQFVLQLLCYSAKVRSTSCKNIDRCIKFLHRCLGFLG